MKASAGRAALFVAIAAACSGSGSSSSATGSGSGSATGSASASGSTSGSGPATGSGSAAGSGSDSLVALAEGAESSSPGEPDAEGGATAAAEDDDKRPDAGAAAAVAVAADSLAAFGYQVDEQAAKAGGTVRVIVRWPDTPHARRASPGDNECQKPRLPTVSPDELWGIGEALVVLDVSRGKAPGPLAPVDVAAESCSFSPRLAVTRPGASLVISSRDAAVRAGKLKLRAWKSARKLEAAASASGKAEARPLRLPWQGHRVAVALAEPGFAQVELDGKHASEDAAWIAVVPSPYAALTDKAGGASFSQVPAGEVAVTAWIPARGGGKAVELSGKLTVKSGQSAELVLTP